MEFSGKSHDFRDKTSAYASLAAQLRGLLNGERDVVANAANTAALLFDALPGVNWAGFYFLRAAAGSAQELVVGPFQGKPACVRIALGAGVCGTAAATRSTVVVPDVHEFPGHIACDGASRSEIVVPLLQGNDLWGVLDIDSPELARFDDGDRRGLEQIAAIFVAACSEPP